jgi:hypothetical protein
LIAQVISERGNAVALPPSSIAESEPSTALSRSGAL